MSQASIGKAALILSTNSSALNSGLKKAEQDTTSTLSRISGGIKGAVASIGSQVANMGGFVGRMASSLMGLGPAGIAVGAAVAGIAASMGLAAASVGRIKDLSDVGRKAAAIGVASEQFMGLGIAARKAGVDSNEFGSLLGKMTGKISGGSAEVANALQMINLPIASLKGQSADVQFKMIAEAISKVQDPGRRAAAALKLFEEQGIKLLPVLTQGKAKLDETVASARASGLALDGRQMAAIERARSALPKLSDAISGFWNKFAVAAAPLVETVAGAISKVVQRLIPVFDWVTRGAEAFYNVVGPFIGEVIDLVFDLGAAFGDWVSDVFDFAGEFPTIEQVITDSLHSIGTIGAYAFDSIRFAIGFVAQALAKLVRITLDVRGQIRDAIVGMIPEKFQPQWFKDFIEMDKLGTEAMEGLADSVEQWGERQQEVFGKSADDVDNWFKKIANKRDDLAKAPIVAMPQIASGFTSNNAMLAGSKEALNAQFRYELGGASSVPQQQLNEQKKTNALLTKLVEDAGDWGGSDFEIVE